MENEISKERLDELVKSIISSSERVITGIPSKNLFFLKKELESIKELSNYTFVTLDQFGKYGTLIATKSSGVENV